MTLHRTSEGPKLVFDSTSGVDEPSTVGTIDMIRELYQGHEDQNGQPIAAHAIRVAKNVRLLDPNASEDALKGALLHDVKEECGLTSDDLKHKRFSDETVSIVDIVSRENGDRRPYTEFIDGIVDSGNREAMLVKLADAIDNGNKHRLQTVRENDPKTADRLQEKYTYAIEKLSGALGIDQEICQTLTERDITMDENFNGVKYFILDDNPVKTVWEEGIITECYRTQPGAADLVRDDRLAYYVETELSDRHEIDASDFENRVKQQHSGQHYD